MKNISVIFVIVSILLTNNLYAEDLETRIDFGASSILGQANDAGAIYLSHRKQNNITSLLSMRLHYRSEILANFQYYEIDSVSNLPLIPVDFIEGEQFISSDINRGVAQ